MERLTRIERLIAAFYCVWFFIHLTLFLYADEGADSTVFWPFVRHGQSLINTYDVSEFLIYTITPLLGFIIYKILFSWQNEEEKNRNHHKHSRHNYFAAFLEEKIKVEELTQKLNELQNKPVSYDHLEELKKDKAKISTEGYNNWLEKIEVKKKYKEFEKG